MAYKYLVGPICHVVRVGGLVGENELVVVQESVQGVGGDSSESAVVWGAKW
jgi:hypothetical protein